MIVSFTLTVEKRSDHDVIEYIYRQYYPLMRYAARRVMFRDTQEAEDAVQDAMIRIINAEKANSIILSRLERLIQTL